MIVGLVLVLEDRAGVEAVVLIVIVLGVEDFVGKDVSKLFFCPKSSFKSTLT